MPTAARCVVLTTLAALLSAAGDALADERPNFVVIMGDDIGYSDYGCYGGEIRTPNIDRLAAEGLRFTQFYNNAVCVPTRYSLLTGLFPRYVGREKQWGLTRDVVTFAEMLRAAGYCTSLSGKWHLGKHAPNRPIDRGFAEYYGLADGCCNYFNPAQRDPEFEGARFRDWMHNDQFIREFPADFYSTDAITDHACAQLRKFATDGKPFLVHVCYTAAHSPLHAKPEDIARYVGRYTGGWDKLRAERRQRQLSLGIIDPRWKVSPREREFVAWEDEPLKDWNANLMAVYAAMVDSLDQGVGRILATLRETGHEANTVVMVLNDNGGCSEQAGGDDPTNVAGPKEHYVSCGPGWGWAQNTPLRRYKAWVHEGGISTPLVVRWPKVVQPGTMTDQVGHIIDVLPTLAELAGTAYPSTREGQPTIPVEGTSLAPIFRGQTRTAPAALYWASKDNRAMREGRWKLVWDQDIRRWELYDVVADRPEMDDLAAQEPVRVRTMTAAWQSWAERTGAVHQLDKKYNPLPKRIRPSPKQ